MKKFLLGVLLLPFHTALFAQAGIPDATFGINGLSKITYLGSEGSAQDVAIAKDGKILLLTYDNYLVRLNNNGTPDSTFDSDGKLNLQALPLDITGDVKAIEIDDSDRIILIVTEWYYFNHKMYIYRLLPDGTLDNKFNEGNPVTFLPFEISRALLAESNGRFIIGGQEDDYHVAQLVRINNDGSSDADFHLTLYRRPGSFIFALAQQADGKILAGGTAGDNAFLFRVLQNGNIDTLFGTDGFTFIDDVNSEAVQGLSVLPDGKIMAVGHTETSDSSSVMCWRFLADGTLDNTFGNNGEEKLYSGARNNFAWFVFAKSDSTVIAGASVFDGVNTIPVLYHLNVDGSIDSTFGENGIAGKNFKCLSNIQLAGNILSNGEIALCGTSRQLGNDSGIVSVFNPDGTLNASFGTGGSSAFTTYDNFPGYSNQLDDLVVLPDDRILAACGNLMLVRLTAEGAVDSSYGVKGFYFPNKQFQGRIMLAKDSGIYGVQAYSASWNSYENLVWDANRFAIFRFSNDGILDPTFGVQGVKEYVSEDYGNILPVDIAMQPGHKLLIAMSDPNSPNVSLMRFDEKGMIDSSFAIDGKQTFSSGPTSFGYSGITTYPDGKIILAYGSFQYPDSEYVRLFRVLPNGGLDSTYNGTGEISFILPFPLNNNLFLQSDNKLILAGKTYGYPYQARFLRLDENGFPDTSYGDGGILSPADPDHYSSLLAQDDKMLVAADNWISPDWRTLNIYRYLPDGSSDSSFGNKGIGEIDSLEYPVSTMIRLQSDGKILVAGQTGNEYYVARFIDGETVSVSEIRSNSSIRIFPNPTSNQLYLSMTSNYNEPVTISVMKITGELMMKENRVASTQMTLDVGNLINGIYLIKINSRENSFTAKFVKE